MVTKERRPVRGGDTEYQGALPRRMIRSHEPYVTRNDTLVPKEKPKEAAIPVKTEEAIFVGRVVGSLSVAFEDKDGQPIKGKAGHGFLVLCPRGGKSISRHFCLASAQPLPSRKALVRMLTEAYSSLKDVKFQQLHLK